MGKAAADLTVVASAPGKVILFGEHAVVYGKMAVAAAVSDLRIVVTAVRGSVSRLRGSVVVTIIFTVFNPLASRDFH